MNKNLTNAKAAKRDEFYTQLADIEKELQHYTSQLKDKVIYCNCDTEESNFTKYFRDNFVTLGIKKLLVSSSDFRGEESIAKLKQADIIITNPPFSLFREYVAQLVEYEKKFLIIGNLNAITYKDIFMLIKENKLWLGINSNKSLWFEMPDHYEKYGKIENGRKYGLVPSITWYTNLDHGRRHEKLPLYKKYSPEEYPNYDNYNAIEVSKVANIPVDYYGVCGVPITFLTKYNPEQFEIIGTTESEGKGFSFGLWKPESNISQAVINKEKIYKRLFIQRRN